MNEVLNKSKGPKQLEGEISCGTRNGGAKQQQEQKQKEQRAAGAGPEPGQSIIIHTEDDGVTP